MDSPGTRTAVEEKGAATPVREAQRREQHQVERNSRRRSPVGLDRSQVPKPGYSLLAGDQRQVSRGAPPFSRTPLPHGSTG